MASGVAGEGASRGAGLWGASTQFIQLFKTRFLAEI